jgi:hypothetical protein
LINEGLNFGDFFMNHLLLLALESKVRRPLSAKCARLCSCLRQVISARSISPSLLCFVVALVQFSIFDSALAQSTFQRLQLKHGLKFLDADQCSNSVRMSGKSDWENGACQLWKLVPAGAGWSRLQLKHGGQFLDADHCSEQLGLNPGSSWEGGACQLWRIVPAGGGWFKLQLKHGGGFLDADHCTDKLGLNPGSDWEGGACQLWRFIPGAGQIID